jgi:hypothetical protein
MEFNLLENDRMKHQIFVSSVQKELAAERQALKDYVHGDPLLRRFFEVFLFDDVPAAALVSSGSGRVKRIGDDVIVHDGQPAAAFISGDRFDLAGQSVIPTGLLEIALV